MQTTIPLSDLIRYFNPRSEVATRIAARFPDGLVCNSDPQEPDVRRAGAAPLVLVCGDVLTPAALATLQSAQSDANAALCSTLDRLEAEADAAASGVDEFAARAAVLDYRKAKRRAWSAYVDAETRTAMALLADPGNWRKPEETS